MSKQDTIEECHLLGWSTLRLLVPASGVPSSPILFSLVMEAIRSSEPSVHTRTTRCIIPEDGILHSHRRENLRSYIALTCWTLKRRRNVFPLRYELGFYIPEDDFLHSYRRENLKSGLCSGDVMCFVWGTSWVCISQKTTFFIVTAVKTSNLT
jgi:hypothetical protein